MECRIWQDNLTNLQMYEYNLTKGESNSDPSNWKWMESMTVKSKENLSNDKYISHGGKD